MSDERTTFPLLWSGHQQLVNELLLRLAALRSGALLDLSGIERDLLRHALVVASPSPAPGVTGEMKLLEVIRNAWGSWAENKTELFEEWLFSDKPLIEAAALARPASPGVEGDSRDLRLALRAVLDLYGPKGTNKVTSLVLKWRDDPAVLTLLASEGSKDSC